MEPGAQPAALGCAPSAVLLFGPGPCHPTPRPRSPAVRRPGPGLLHLPSPSPHFPEKRRCIAPTSPPFPRPLPLQNRLLCHVFASMSSYYEPPCLPFPFPSPSQAPPVTVLLQDVAGRRSCSTASPHDAAALAAPHALARRAPPPPARAVACLCHRAAVSSGCPVRCPEAERQRPKPPPPHGFARRSLHRQHCCRPLCLSPPPTVSGLPSTSPSARAATSTRVIVAIFTAASACSSPAHRAAALLCFHVGAAGQSSPSSPCD
ncbi:hypothetical protein E2562_028564 [Oryza meyeriana var. granulata]|uniref:Uncharacterized protein n=1 Tax=Oryza meyeriana var. granulata TaxID=110450 RepID=A0A6G1FCX9_9ORYZ|nr:hypothetical protein E2562_028564 [Oryza meyeriana var. granulata]